MRADTPGCRDVVHLNNAGAALVPRPVLDAVRGHLELEARVGGYEAADGAAGAVEAVYRSIGRLVGAPPGRVALTEHATASFNQAVSSVPFGQGDVLITTRNDYASNQIAYLSLRDRLGVEVVRAPELPEGGVDPAALEGLVHRRRPKLVAVTWVPTNSGLVQDVEAVGEICRRREVLFLVDACQAVGQMPVDVESVGCDFLTATGRKFLRGPRGTGFLVVSDRALDMGLEPLLPDMRGADWIADGLYQPAPDAKRFETWETAWALALGLGAAADYALEVRVEAIRDRSRELAERLRDGLAGIGGVTVLDRGHELCAICTAHVEAADHGALVAALRRRGFNTSLVARTSAVLDMDDKGVEEALRISPHAYNTAGEVDAFLEALGELAAGRAG